MLYWVCLRKNTPTFDTKFGDGFLAALPQTPAVYFIYNEGGDLIYIGKAKNLRRRLSQYRNAKRRKKHRKMKSIVLEADRIEYQLCQTDLEACRLEMELIQKNRPRWNVAGAFHFLYPLIGLRREGENIYFCFSTTPEAFSDFQFYGAFRSRHLSGDAFFALRKLLKYIGHPIATKPSPVKYSYIYGFRKLPENFYEDWSAFLKGESKVAIENLVLALVENAGARRRPKQIQENLRPLARFWQHEVRKLSAAIESSAYPHYPVPQRERDLLFLEHLFKRKERANLRVKKRAPSVAGPK